MTMDSSHKFDIKQAIERLDSSNHKEIFRIFKKYDVQYSENKNGIFINLTHIDDIVLNEIKEYLLYVNKQEKDIDTLESQKQKVEQSFFAQTAKQ